MADAELILDMKRGYEDGAIAQVRIWRLPQALPPSAHGLKYSLFYGYPGQRLVGYDNERGKGDHRHIEAREDPYQFVSVERLLDDFWTDVTQARKR